MRCLSVALRFLAILASAVSVFVLIETGSARANDSASELAIGGLVMVKTDAISIQREDLSISPLTVRVRYEMRNNSDHPVTLRVAFPLPEVPLDTPSGMHVFGANGEMIAHMVDWPSNNGPNFVGFAVRVDGKPITPEVEVKANLPDGRDVTQALRDIGGWWLVLHPRMFIPQPVLSDLGEADRDIGTYMTRQLHELGVVEGDDPIWPKWRTHITFHWLQTFPPGVTIVEHRYRPILGYFLVDPKRDNGPSHAEDALDHTYCLNPEKRSALQALVTSADRNYLVARTLGYILTTGANWAGPIGTFHLELDGHDPQRPAAHAGLLALCAPIPLSQDGSLRLEGMAHDFTPAADLKVMMVDR